MEEGHKVSLMEEKPTNRMKQHPLLNIIVDKIIYWGGGEWESWMDWVGGWEKGVPRPNLDFLSPNPGLLLGCVSSMYMQAP